MIALRRISTNAVLQTWASVPPVLTCPLGEVNGASVGWSSGDYELVSLADPAPTAPTEAELYTYAATKRWGIENGGITVGGMSVATDERTRGLLTAAYIKASADSGYTIANYKIAANTYVTLSTAQIIAIAEAVEAHVQACFDANSAIDAKIADETYTTFADIDTAAEWPD